MLELGYQGRVTASNDSFDTAISDLEVVRDVLVSVSRDGGGLASWAIDAAGLPVLTRMRGAETGSVTGEGAILARYEGTSVDGVIVAGFAAGLLDVSPVNGSQTVGSPQDRSAGSGTWAHVVQVREDLLVVSEAGGDGFHLFRDTGGSAFSDLRHVSDTGQSHADSITAMATAQIDGREFLFVGSGTEQGVSSYEVWNSSVTLRDSHGPMQGLGLMVPTALETVRVEGTSFLLVATAAQNGASGALSVMEIGTGGQLRPTDHVLDTLYSRFGQVQSLSSLAYGDMALIAAGGGDDGVSLLALSPEGRLVHLDAFADTVAAGLSDITALEMSLRGDVLRIYAASEETRGITVLTVDLSDYGVLRTANGGTQGGSAGDDILIDGPGAETLNGQLGSNLFVMGSDGVMDRIQNFDPNTDKIDLSSWAFLYDVNAIDIRSTTKGARLSWRGEELDIRSRDGGSLDVEAVRDALQIDINRSFYAPSTEVTGSGASEALAGTWGNDTLIGGGGNDTLEGGAGDDTIIGGSGTDQVLFRALSTEVEGLEIAGDRVTIVTGEGTDRIEGVERFVFEDVTLSLSELNTLQPPRREDGSTRGDRIEVTDTRADLDGGAGNDTLRTGAFEDTLRGGSGNDSLNAGAGDDILIGGTGDDTLEGGAGDDTLLPGTGNTRLDGGSGSDQVVLEMVSNAAQVTAYVDGRVTLVTPDGVLEIAGIEWFIFDNQTLSLAQMAARVAPLEIEGSAGSDVLSVPGNSNARVIGYAGDDVLTAADGDDFLSGGDGIDTIRAGRGDDTIEGGNAADAIWGDGGHDTIRGNAGQDTLRGGIGNDLIYGDRDADVLRGQKESDTLYGGSGDDNIKGGGGNDLLFGEAGDDFLKGGSRRDTLNGGSGDDMLNGNSFDDTLNGGAGHDTLRAGGENDRLEGGSGNDVLKGGGGSDVFVFAMGHDMDRIDDFDPERDRLLLSLSLTNGADNPSLILTNFADQQADGVQFDFGGGDTILLAGLSLTGLSEAITLF